MAERTPPASVTLCLRWRDGFYCLGLHFNGSCVRCGTSKHPVGAYVYAVHAPTTEGR